MEKNEKKIEAFEADPSTVISDESKYRDKKIIKTSIIGILANVLLASFKAIIGILSNSIAVVLDAINNISDATSSVVTIVGTKLSRKKPNKKHPFGYGRVEYLSALIIAVLVLYAGITSLIESIKQIIHPDIPDYSITSLVIIAAAVLVKIILGRYVKSVGKKVYSDSLINSGKDAILDSIISASTLLAAVIYLWKGISLEAWLGAVISLVIIKSGIEMLIETISKILGERVDAELARKIKETVMSFDVVGGVYDLILHNYGPDTYNGSIHIEVPDTLSASELDELLREISVKVYIQHHVILTAIGVYSENTTDPKSVETEKIVREIVMSTEYVIEMHAFYLNEVKKTLRFDVVISFDAKDRQAVYLAIYEKIQARFPDYILQIALDTDYSVS